MHTFLLVVIVSTFLYLYVAALNSTAFQTLHSSGLKIDVHNGMQCEFGGNRDFIDKLNVFEPKECPTLLNDPYKEYCCLDESNHFYCCTAQEFVFNKYGILLIIVVCVAIGLLLSCCLCCLCCPCCCWYKRRHGGIVYASKPY